MDSNIEYRQQMIAEYKEALKPFLQYIPWFEANAGKPGGGWRRGTGGEGESSIGIPVYDATLLNFVKAAARSPLADRNYHYTYTRGRIRDHEDERRVIAAAELKDWDVLRGILSKYVLGGMTKSTLWIQGMQENIFLLVLQKMKEILEYWDKSMGTGTR